MALVGKIVTRRCRRILGFSVHNESGSCRFFSTSSHRMYDKTRYSPEYYSYKEKMDHKRCYQYLSSLSEAEQRRLQCLQMEYEVMKASGEYELPETMNLCRWRDILHIDDATYIEYLYKCFQSDDKDLIERRRKTKIMENQMTSYIMKMDESGFTEKSLIYLDEDCVKNRQHIQDISIDICSHKFSRDIVIDFGDLTREKKFPKSFYIKLHNLRLILEMNRNHRQPLNIHIANCSQVKRLGKECLYELDKLKENFLFVTYHEEPVFTNFEKDRLVYISHWISDDLQDSADHIPILLLEDNLNRHKTYVDTVVSHGIKQAKLPVHQYIQFAPKERYFFSLAESVGVLQDVYFSHDWLKAFTNNILLPSNRFVLKETVSKHIMHEPITRKDFRDLLKSMKKS